MPRYSYQKLFLLIYAAFSLDSAPDWQREMLAA